MEIKYLFHSGVSVVSNHKLMIFDYYNKGITKETLLEHSEVYVFVSHNHGDHFDKEILTWDKMHENIHYIFSDDIPPEIELKKVTYVKENEKIIINGLHIKTLHSTDQGVAFFVTVDGENIFHAGDLNWWHWEGETVLYNQQMKNDFIAEMNKLIGNDITVAFIPVDQRLNDAAYYSIDYLMSHHSVKMVCPIHFSDDFTFLADVKKELANRAYFDKINFYEEEQR